MGILTFDIGIGQAGEVSQDCGTKVCKNLDTCKGWGKKSLVLTCGLACVLACVLTWGAAWWPLTTADARREASLRGGLHITYI